MFSIVLYMSINHTTDYYSTSMKNVEEILIKNPISTTQHKVLFNLKTDIDQDIISVSKSLNTILEQVSTLESDNALLVSKIQTLEDKREGSAGMYDDSRNLYNSKLLENSILFISICVLSYNIYKSITK